MALMQTYTLNTMSLFLYIIFHHVNPTLYMSIPHLSMWDWQTCTKTDAGPFPCHLTLFLSFPFCECDRKTTYIYIKYHFHLCNGYLFISVKEVRIMHLWSKEVTLGTWTWNVTTSNNEMNMSISAIFIFKCVRLVGKAVILVQMSSARKCD